MIIKFIRKTILAGWNENKKKDQKSNYPKVNANRLCYVVINMKI